MASKKLARVYAKALIDQAQEQKELDQVRNDMQLVRQVLAANSQLRVAFASPVIKEQTKQKVFEELFKDQLSKLALQFGSLAVSKGRAQDLAPIAQAVEEAYREIKGIEHARVTTAYELSSQELQRLREKLAELTGKQIELENTISEAIIGGMIVRVGDRQYNGSVASELARLRRDFKKNQYVPEI